MKSILVTGGTGSFGNAFVERMLRHDSTRIIVYSRGELLQKEMRERFPSTHLDFVIGDVRDAEKLIYTARRADTIVHAAALKHVPVGEIHPDEVVKTNVGGTMNAIAAAHATDVNRFVLVSSDKAVNPSNLYGATKMAAEHLVTAANLNSKTIFCSVRYGNVIGSRGSILPMFLKQKEAGLISITDKRMTRFWITLEEAVELVRRALNTRRYAVRGGEIFIPKVSACTIENFAMAVAPKALFQYIGIRPGEKLHEALIAPEEVSSTLDQGDYFVVIPQIPVLRDLYYHFHKNLQWVPKDFQYTSETARQFSKTELRSLINEALRSMPNAKHPTR